MNIIRARQEERINKINQLSKTLKKAKDKGVEIDEKKLIYQAMDKWGMSERVIKEYLKVAKFKNA